MKEYKQVRRCITEQELLRVLCDHCGKEIPDTSVNYSREFVLHFLEGWTYPESGDMRGWQIEDLCDDCAAQLRAMLTEQGWDVKEKERYW